MPVHDRQPATLKQNKIDIGPQLDARQMTLARRYPGTPGLVPSLTGMGENAGTVLARMVTSGISED
jgi:hypothetical protein